jgi:hypothetical protein
VFKTNQITTAALFCSIGAILQLMPVLFSELFTIFTLLSTIPIYLISRKNKQLGMVSYITTATIVLFFNGQEFIIFAFLNGIVGLTLGILNKFKYYSCLITGSILASSIIFVNFVIGIPLFGISISVIIIIIIIIFAFIYTSIYYKILIFLSNNVAIFKKYLND